MDEKKLKEEEIKEKENEVNEDEDVIIDENSDENADENNNENSNENTKGNSVGDSVDNSVNDSVDNSVEDNTSEIGEDVGDTFTPSEDESVNESIEEEPAATEKMLTQSQVNELVGRARQEGRESAMRELYERYGVSDDDEMNGIFGKGQAYDALNDEFIGQGDSYRNVMAENALLKTNIDMNRWEDVKLILGGKGMEVNEENINAELATHPEWRAVTGADGKTIISPQEMDGIVSGQVIGSDKTFTNMSQQKQPARLKKLGNEANPNNEISDDERAKQLFGI